MPFERLLFVRFAAPPDVVLDVIFRLGLAGIAVFEDRPPYFSQPPVPPLVADVEALGRFLDRLGLEAEARPPRAGKLSEALRKALDALRACTAGYRLDDVVGREAAKRAILSCLAERGTAAEDLAGIYRAAKEVLDIYGKSAYSEGPDTGKSFAAMAAEVAAKEEELRRLGALVSFLEWLEGGGYSRLRVPEGYRVVLEPREPIPEPHQLFELGGFKVAIVAGGAGRYGGVEVPREYLLDIHTARELLRQTIASVDEALGRLKRSLAEMYEVYRAYSAFGDARWEDHAGTATVSFYIRERDAAKLDEILAGALGGVYVPRRLVAYKTGAAYKLIRTPTSERWPYPIKAFSRILYMYGPPAPGEVSPLPLVAFLFPFFYGWMFGDVGYGLLLLVLALVLLRVGRKDWGFIWLTTSAATVAFGLYYGDFFGLKLWGVRQELDYMTGMAAAMMFGYYLMALAFVLKTAQSALSGDAPAAAALHAPMTVIYLSIGASLLRYINMPQLLYGRPFVDIAAKACGALADLRVLLAGASWLASGIAALALKYGAVYLREIGGELIFSTMEAFIAATANVLSFARLAIVYIAHGIFTSAALSLLDLPAGFALYALAQLLIAGFEGFLTAIQSLRLIYYETLSKFYRGSGRLFEPFKLGRREPERA
ncbi:MAG: V-type ATPase 116kDa subunit family protein [Thermoproteus sp.]